MSEPTAIGELLVPVGIAVSALPGVGNRGVLFNAMGEFRAGRINEAEFIAIHYEWIFDNVLDAFKKHPLPEKSEVLRALEGRIRLLPKSHREDPNVEERSMIQVWMKFVESVDAVKQENAQNLRWLRAMEKYFKIRQLIEKARIVNDMILDHNNEVSW